MLSQAYQDNIEQDFFLKQKEGAGRGMHFYGIESSKNVRKYFTKKKIYKHNH